VRTIKVLYGWKWIKKGEKDNGKRLGLNFRGCFCNGSIKEIKYILG
jgi:hypothetical protein